jgi:hypothetical protein
MPYDYSEFTDEVQVADPEVLPCARCGGTDRWQDRGVARCRGCAPAPQARAVVIPLACRTCGSVSRPDRQRYPDGSILYRCAVCHRPRGVSH